ncbi:MAG: FlgN protein [Pseudomonadota bacterium]|jgi:flagellar biosynthesis/type III secretory pathway chaperone
MEKGISTSAELFSQLERLVKLHQQLAELLRVERLTLVSMNLPQIQEVSEQKQSLLHQIALEEAHRVRLIPALSVELGVSAEQATLSPLIQKLQVRDLALAERFVAIRDRLMHLVSEIQSENQSNARFLEASIDHVNQMKKNILGEATPRSGTYSSTGHPQTTAAGSRLISREV